MTLEILDAYHELKDKIRRQDNIITEQELKLIELQKELGKCYTIEYLKTMFITYDKDSIWVADDSKEELYNMLNEEN